MTRQLYVNRPAILANLKKRFPQLPDDFHQQGVEILIERVCHEYTIDSIGEPDFIFTDIDLFPEDADIIRGDSVLLTPGMPLWSIVQRATDEVEGVKPEDHHVLRWGRRFLTQRDALLFARYRFDTPALSQGIKQLIAAEWDRNAPEPNKPINLDIPVVHVSGPRSYKLVSERTMEEFLDDLRHATRLGLDTETQPNPDHKWPDAKVKPNLRKRFDKVVGMSFSTAPGTGWWWDPRVTKTPLVQIAQALLDPKLPKVLHNALFDLAMIRTTYGIKVQGPIRDTMVMSWLLGNIQNGLKHRALEDLGIRMIEFDEMLDQYEHPGLVPASKMLDYAAADGDIPLRLEDLYLPRLHEEELMAPFELEMALIPAIHEMEWKGMYADKAAIEQLDKEFIELIAEERAKLDAIAGIHVPVTKREAVSHIISQLGYMVTDPRRRNKKGLISTDKDTLGELMMSYPKDPFLLQLSRVNQMMTLQTNFTSKLPHNVNPLTGRIHPDVNPSRAKTGRMGMQNPNLQQIPSRSKLGKKLREVFMGQGDNELLVADQSQIEMRVIAHLCKDPYLMGIFTGSPEVRASTGIATGDIDIYKAVGSRILRIPYDDVVGQKRDTAKIAVLAPQYGGSEYSMARTSRDPLADPPFQLTVPEAKAIKDGYFDEVPGIPRYIYQRVMEAREYGFVRNEYGYKTRLPNINHPDPSKRGEAERLAANSPIQGLATVVLKIGVVELYKRGIIPINIVHDEIITEGDRKTLEDQAPIIREVLETCYPISVPLKTEPGIGRTWLDAK